MRAYAAPDTQALRGWQRRALVRYLGAKPRDFLAVATPGAGKTAFALRIAGELLADGTVERITVVVPTEHLKTQWAQAAARVGIALDRMVLRKSATPNAQTPIASRPTVPPEPSDPSHLYRLAATQTLTDLSVTSRKFKQALLRNALRDHLTSA